MIFVEKMTSPLMDSLSLEAVCVCVCVRARGWRRLLTGSMKYKLLYSLPTSHTNTACDTSSVVKQCT